VAILVARNLMADFGLGDGLKQESLVLHQEGINESITLWTSVNYGSCLDKFGSYSEFYGD
jgi:hypothetical protein